jgi:hypothetical protein
MRLVEIADRWINPDRVSHVNAIIGTTAPATRIWFDGKDSIDVSGAVEDVVRRLTTLPSRHEAAS